MAPTYQQTLIHSPAPDLQVSKTFYQQLGFSLTAAADSATNGSWIASDSQCTIELNPTPYARAGLKLFAPDWKEIIASLNGRFKVSSLDPGYLLTGPSGIYVYLHETAIDYPLNDSPSLLGNFAGISLESHEIERSIQFWEGLGFKISHGSLEQGWLSLERNGFSVSLMPALSCPHLFFNPSLTYFNGKNNMQIIAQIRKKGINITQEITHFNPAGEVDNIIIRDPGGYGFFIFSD